MKDKTAELLRQIDPDLKVVVRKHRRNHAQDCNGAYCPRCGHETFRLVQTKRGKLCPHCNAKLTEEQASKLERQYLYRKLLAGEITLRNLKEGRY